MPGSTVLAPRTTLSPHNLSSAVPIHTPRSQTTARTTIKLIDTKPVTLRTVGDKKALCVIVPVQITGKSEPLAKPKVRDVTFNGRHESGWLRAFSAQWGKNKERPVLLLKVLTNQLTSGVFPPPCAGTYGVTLQPTLGANEITINILYPAANLSGPKTVKFVHTWPESTWNPVEESLLLRERSRLTPVEQIRLTASNGSGFLPNTLSVQDGEKRINAGEHQVRVIQGHWNISLGLGTSEAMLEVDSPQLSNPVSVPVTIEQRLSLVFIGLFTVFGILMGYFIRKYLQASIERGAERLRAFGLLDQINKICLETRDRNLAEKLGEQATLLETLTKDTQTTADTLKARIDAIAQEIEKIQENFEESLIAARTQSLDWLLTANAQRSLPTNLFSLVAEFQLAAKKIAELIREGNLAQGEEEKAAWLQQGGTQLLQQAYEWRTGLEARFANLASAEGWPQTVADDLKQILERGQDLFNAITEPPGVVSFEDIKRVLDAVHGARTSSIALGQRLRIRQAAEFNAAMQILQQVVPPIGALPVLQEKSNQVLSNLDELIKAPDKSETHDDLVASLGQLGTTLRQILQAEIRRLRSLKVSAARQAKLNDELDELDKLAATNEFWTVPRQLAFLQNELAQEMSAGFRAEGGANEAMMGAPPPVFQPLFIPEVGAPLSWVRPSMASGGLVASSLAAYLDMVERPKKISQRDLVANAVFIARNIQTGVSGVLIILLGYLLFAPSFIGTFADLGAIFLWAFGLDVTFNTLIEQFNSNQASIIKSS